MFQEKCPFLKLMHVIKKYLRDKWLVNYKRNVLFRKLECWKKISGAEKCVEVWKCLNFEMHCGVVLDNPALIPKYQKSIFQMLIN